MFVHSCKASKPCARCEVRNSLTNLLTCSRSVDFAPFDLFKMLKAVHQRVSHALSLDDEEHSLEPLVEYLDCIAFITGYLQQNCNAQLQNKQKSQLEVKKLLNLIKQCEILTIYF